MGRRGPPPKPTRLKVISGNPGKRPLNKREPQPRKETPRCPNWLTPEAKRVWRDIVPKLKRMGVLTEVDGGALAGYSQTCARWRNAEEFIAKHGEVYPLRDSEGRVRYMQQLPQVSIARNLLQLVRGYQQEFGLTPSARSRIQVAGAPDEDTFDSFRNELRSAR